MQWVGVMSAENDGRGGLPGNLGQRDAAGRSVIPTHLNLGNGTSIALGGLSARQIADIQEQYARGMIDVKKKCEQMRIVSRYVSHHRFVLSSIWINDKIITKKTKEGKCQ